MVAQKISGSRLLLHVTLLSGSCSFWDIGIFEELLVFLLQIFVLSKKIDSKVIPVASRLFFYKMNHSVWVWSGRRNKYSGVNVFQKATPHPVVEDLSLILYMIYRWPHTDLVMHKEITWVVKKLPTGQWILITICKRLVTIRRFNMLLMEKTTKNNRVAVSFLSEADLPGRSVF